MVFSLWITFSRLMIFGYRWLACNLTKQTETHMLQVFEYPGLAVVLLEFFLHFHPDITYTDIFIAPLPMLRFQLLCHTLLDCSKVDNFAGELLVSAFFASHMDHPIGTRA